MSKAYESTILSEDINSDGIVDYTDWGLCVIAVGYGPGDPNWNPYADMNADNAINNLDLAVLDENYGSNDP